MAEFLSAYAKVMGHEGGYVNDPQDRGGETYAGITRKNYPDWEGWPIVDRYKPLERGEIIEDVELSGQVKAFYKRTQWDKVKGDLIDSQKVATFLFDWYVNSGRTGIKEAQRAVGLTPDGVIGTASLQKINKYHERTMLDILKNARRSFVRDIVKVDPSQRKFLNGWLNRIASF